MAHRGIYAIAIHLPCKLELNANVRRQFEIGRYHLAIRLITHFTVPRRVEGWVNMCTAVNAQPVPKAVYRSGFLKNTEMSAARFSGFDPGTSCIAVSRTQWRQLHRARGHVPPIYKWLGTGAPWVEVHQARNWPNCTDHHESAHQNDLSIVLVEPKKWRVTTKKFVHPLSNSFRRHSEPLRPAVYKYNAISYLLMFLLAFV